MFLLFFINITCPGKIRFLHFVGATGPRQLRLRFTASVADATAGGEWNLPAAWSPQVESLQFHLTTITPPNRDANADKLSSVHHKAHVSIIHLLDMEREEQEDFHFTGITCSLRACSSGSSNQGQAPLHQTFANTPAISPAILLCLHRAALSSPLFLLMFFVCLF